MSTEFAQKPSNIQRMEAGLITITSPYENAIVTCHKVVSSGKMAGGKNHQSMLFLVQAMG